MVNAVKIDKATYKDLRRQVDNLGLGYLADIDDSYIYIENSFWDEDDNHSYITMRFSYKWENSLLQVDMSSKREVVRDTSYQVVDSQSAVENSKMGNFLKNFTGTTKKQEPVAEVQEKLLKKFSPSEMKIVEALYMAGGETDAHGDVYEDPVEGPKQLVKSILEARDKGSLQYSIGHIHSTSVFEIVDAWVNVEETTLEDGTVIPPNQPIAVTKFNNETAYNDRVDGKLTGLSIGALARAEVIKTLQDSMVGEDKPLRKLSNFVMTHKAGHLAYTIPAQSGAASKINKPIKVMKSNLDSPLAKLIEEEYANRYGEELTELDKSKMAISGNVDKTAPSTSENEAQDAGVDNENLNKGKDDIMSEVEAVKKEFESYKKAVKLEKTFGKYSLSEETVEGLATSCAQLDDSDAIVKALDEMVQAFKTEKESLEEANKAALEEAKESISKATEKENPFAAILSKELGEGAPVVHKSASTIAAVDELLNAK